MYRYYVLYAFIFVLYVTLTFVTLCDQDPAFLYGLGITYFHFSAYQWYVNFMSMSVSIVKYLTWLK